MIFNIQRYPTHDGPDIRTVVSLKGCSLSCRWCQNPENRARTQNLLCDACLCLDGCDPCAQAAPAVIERALGGLLTHHEKLTDDALTVLTDRCPAQALIVCGEVESVDDIMATVLRDKPFHDRGGGGLTLPGGEPFMQPELAATLLRASHDAGIHTTVETCLHIPWEYIEPSLLDVDLFLADLKHVADAPFKQWTDGRASRVLENLKKLAAAGKKMITRVPLIQGFNTDEATIQATTDSVADELHVGEIHFLPYHTLDISKYYLLSQPYNAPDKPLDVPTLLEFAQQYASLKGLTATLRG